MSLEDKINQLMVDVGVIKTKIESIETNAPATTYDHETRIRSLEKSRNRLMGAIAAGNLLSGVIGFFASLIMGHR